MDKREALQLLREVIQRLRERSRNELLALSDCEVRELTGTSGQPYQVEIRSFWDNKPGQDLRVQACIDDGSLRALAPLCMDFIVAPDGSFVGE